jgi:hypothetical protein
MKRARQSAGVCVNLERVSSGCSGRNGMLRAGRAARCPAVDHPTSAPGKKDDVMPQRDARIAVGERNSGMSKIGRTTRWTAVGGLVLSGLVAGVFHNAAASAPRVAHGKSEQSTIVVPSSPPASTSSPSQVTSGGS